MLNNFPNFASMLNRRPNAWANICGSESFPAIQGNVLFYQTSYGVLVVSQIAGLPKATGSNKQPIFAYHIHDGSSCTGNNQDSFLNAGSHYNPNNCPHPYHSGDLPPLFGANGYAFSVVLTDRISVSKLIGKTIIIHSQVDDFKTQPAGDSGKKIACGEIKIFK